MEFRIPELWDRYKFLDATKEPTITGIVVEREVVEGQYSLKVLIEKKDLNPNRVDMLSGVLVLATPDEVAASEAIDPNNPFGLAFFWDYECHEFLGKASLEEMLLNENENVRNFALKHQDVLNEITSASDGDISLAQKRQTLKTKLATASDAELDSLIDQL
jgi:hypothetical protein